MWVWWERLNLLCSAVISLDSLFHVTHEESWMLLFHFFSMDSFVRKDVRDLSVIYSFGRNFLACVTKAASVHTLEGCSVLWITGVSFEEPSLPCTGTLGALACEKGGNKVVKFAQSTPPPPPAPFYSSPVFPTQHEVKDRTDARHLTNTSDDSCACIGHREHIYNLINTNQSNVHGFLMHLTPKYVVSCINWLD